MSFNNFHNPWGNNNYGSFPYEDEPISQERYTGLSGIIKTASDISETIAPVLRFIPEVMNSTARIRESNRHEYAVQNNTDDIRRIAREIAQEVAQEVVRQVVPHLIEQMCAQIIQPLLHQQQAMLVELQQPLALPAPPEQDEDSEE